MLMLRLPWLELAIAVPLIGALAVLGAGDPERAQRRTFCATLATLALTLAAWADFSLLHAFEAHEHWSPATALLGDKAVVIDELSAPLLPLTALMFCLTTLATLKTKLRRFPFAWNLVSLSLLLAMLSCRSPWGIIGLLAAQAVPPAAELVSRRKPVRPFVLHMAVGVGLLALGWALLDRAPAGEPPTIALLMVITGVLIRSGCVPAHCWMTDLFENASLGTALLYVTPMAGAYATTRLILPIAPDWSLEGIIYLSMITAVYAAGMALVQCEARRFFVYLLLSHSSLVLVGLAVATPIGLTGGLCVWLSVGLSLTGFGLTLRSVEARTGRLSLASYHGLYDHMPGLASFFLLTGLASIGFPGTVGFIGVELLVDGAVGRHPLIGVLVVGAAALNGIAVLHAYFRLFTGAEHTASISLRERLPEKVTILTLSLLTIAGGLIPQPGVASRHHAATEALARRHGAASATSPGPVARGAWGGLPWLDAPEHDAHPE